MVGGLVSGQGDLVADALAELVGAQAGGVLSGAGLVVDSDPEAGLGSGGGPLEAFQGGDGRQGVVLVEVVGLDLDQGGQPGLGVGGQGLARVSGPGGPGSPAPLPVLPEPCLIPTTYR